jgi:hypothetical protein
MSKDKISDYSATANSNTDIAGINIDEGCAPSGINNAIRTLMKQLKDFQQGTNSDSFNGPTNGAHNGSVGATTPAAGTFTTLSATGNVTLGDASADTVTVNGTTNFVAAPTIGGVGLGMGFKNRIINGAMMIDQRNAGASVGTSSGSSVYTLDRWIANYTQTSKFTIQQNAGSVTPPVGFTNYLGVTSSSAYSVGSSDFFYIGQKIEGFNTADLAWGTANAKTVTLSFQVYSSLTGTFGGVLWNSALNRNYPFSYTVSSANTWTSISVTITGDTTGTWLTTNSTGVQVNFSLGAGSTYSGTAGAWSGTTYVAPTGSVSVVGTSGATFYITGVQLEKGSTATSFDYRPYGTELALCQRYYEKSYDIGTTPGTATTNNGAGVLANYNGSSTNVSINTIFKVTKRSAATVTSYSPATGASGKWQAGGSDATPTVTNAGTNSAWVYGTGNNNYMHFTAESEL